MNTLFDDIAIALMTFVFSVAAPLMLVGALLSA
jgi:hypothetical protein